MDRRQFVKVLQRLEKHCPDAEFYIQFKSPFQLLIASLLTPKVKDEVVNAIIPRLFTKYKNTNDYANASLKQLSRDILPVSFATVKARRIKGICKIIVQKYHGEIPNTMQDLLGLPGIGRKTANTILINAFGKVEGIPVDTNVARVTYRLGWTKRRNPDTVEQDLMQLVPKDYWKSLPYLLKTHGRRICKPRIPECTQCFLSNLCHKQGVNKYS